MVRFESSTAKILKHKSCPSPTANTSRQPSLRKRIMLLYYWLLLTLTLVFKTVSQSTPQDGIQEDTLMADHVGYSWHTRIVPGAGELSECEGLGFKNSSKNACGFCIGGSTMLPENYFMDCSGKCSGSQYGGLDCNNECGGKAYVDECSGQCIGGSSNKDEKDVESFRDCRGSCKSFDLKLMTDVCTVCHTGFSPFQDCTNNCHLPGQEKLMAKVVCGRCIGGMTNYPESEVLNPCGYCKGESDPPDCPCNGTGSLDACGVCNGNGASCMRVLRFHPRALLVDTRAKVVIEGAFRGRTGNIKCLFTELLRMGMGNVTEFPAEVKNGTHIQCTVKLNLGSYRVGAKITVGDPEESDFVEDVELVVYEKTEYTNMSPTSAVFDRVENKDIIVTFSGGRVPRLPLICVVSEEGNKNTRLVPSNANTLDTCNIPFPNKSTKLTITPSFNGFQVFERSFHLEFSASSPNMVKGYIAEDGHAVVIIFDRPVNLCGLEKCEQMLNTETLERVGSGAKCMWATKQQLIITVQNPIKVNSFRVTFLKNVLRQDGQKYALRKNENLIAEAWHPQPVSNAKLAISGPSTIPNCGVFTLVGHFSSPKGNADFYWTAYRDDQIPLETSIANALLGVRSASLTLNASLLEVDMGYSFVLTAEHPGNDKYEVRHKVTALSYIGPLVTAYSDVMTQSSVTVDQRITLNAETSLPECSNTKEFLHLMWTVSNPEVKFHFKSRHMQVYIIEPYTLPENSIVTFYANAYFGNRLNVTTSQVQFRVEPAKLKVSIKGAPKRVVGNRNGNLVLESGLVNRGFRLVYQWRCSDQDGPICYNYKENSTEPLLIPRKSQNQRKLVIPCENLKPGKMLTFELQIFDANNRNQYSQTASTVVIVEDKDIPQVFIQSVLADGSTPIQQHPTTGAYKIPAGLSVSVYATINPSSDLKSIKWDIKGFSSPFSWTAKAGMTILSLEEGFLVGHGIYIIGLSACNMKGACGMANLTIHAVPGIALCSLQIPAYVEYEQVRIEVKNCSIPNDRQPVTYQLYLHSIDSVFPLTAPQTSTIFNIIGPSPQIGTKTQISVQACDKYQLCTLFDGPLVKVSFSENKEEDRKALINKALLSVENRNLLPAISMLLTAASDPTTKFTKNEEDILFDAASKATYNKYINAGQLSLLYSSMLPLIHKDNINTKVKALDIIKRSTKLAFAYDVKVPSSVLSQGHSNSAEAMQGHNSDSALGKKVKEVMEYFVRKISTSLPLGSKILLESKQSGYPVTMLFRQLPGNPISIKAKSKDGEVESIVKFEDNIRRRIRFEKCTKSPKPNRECDTDDVVVAATLYPAKAPYSSDRKKSSPVLDLTLRNPYNGAPLPITEATNAIKISMTHNLNNTGPQDKSMVYRCSFWDESLKDWSDDGLVSYGVEGKLMQCWSSHLSAFAVVETYKGLSTGAVVGIVVTVLMGVFIIMMFAFFFFRKKQAAQVRVSHETLPKRDKLQSVSGSLVKVKTITP